MQESIDNAMTLEDLVIERKTELHLERYHLENPNGLAKSSKEQLEFEESHQVMANPTKKTFGLKKGYYYDGDDLDF